MAVWAVLTDGAGYPAWDSGVVRVEGTIAPGEKIKVVSAINPRRAFPVKVAEFTPGRRTTWSGGMPLGLFKGVRHVHSVARGQRHDRFEMREEFTGPMLGLIWKSIPDFGRSFEQFARELKERRKRPLSLDPPIDLS